MLWNAAIPVDRQPERIAAPHRPRRLLLLRGGGRGRHAHRAVLRILAGHCQPPDRAAKPVRVVRARAANDQHLEGRVGGPQPWRLLAAPGDFLASRRGPGAVDVHTARSRLRGRHARAHRRSPRSSAQRAGIHIADPRERGGDPPLLPVGHRACGADFAKDPWKSGVYGRCPGESLAQGGRHDPPVDGSLPSQRLAAAATVRAGRPRAACGGTRRDSPAVSGACGGECPGPVP